MANAKETEETQEIISPVEYDSSLCHFLLENRFDAVNILDICQSGLLLRRVAHSRITDVVKKIQKEHQSGCVFVLPARTGDNLYDIMYSPMSSNEIRRIVSLKVFL